MHLTFAYAKPRFALFFEDVADVDAGAFLDLGVAIEELLAEQGREPPPDGGLAGAHGPDEIDVTLAEHGCVGYLKTRRPPKGAAVQENPAGAEAYSTRAPSRRIFGVTKISSSALLLLVDLLRNR